MESIRKEDLRVGMVVQGVGTSGCWKNKGKYVPFRITSINMDPSGATLDMKVGRITLDGNMADCSTRWCSCGDLYHLTLVEDAPPTIEKFLKPTFTKTMSNIIEFFRNMTASADEKLLKEMGIEDPVGTPTEVGIRLSNEISYKANRAAVIEIARKMKDEEEAKKKS